MARLIHELCNIAYFKSTLGTPRFLWARHNSLKWEWGKTRILLFGAFAPDEGHGTIYLHRLLGPSGAFIQTIAHEAIHQWQDTLGLDLNHGKQFGTYQLRMDAVLGLV